MPDARVSRAVGGDIGARWHVGIIREQSDGRSAAAGVLVSFSAVEVQAVADADIVSLRALLVPDYAGVATSFAQLLLRVVRRCQRDNQVRGLIIQKTSKFLGPRH